MTGKRYKARPETVSYIDTVTGEILRPKYEMGYYNVLDRLNKYDNEYNKLKKENEQLKSKINKLDDKLYSKECDVFDLKKENEQLKEDNDIKFWKQELMIQWNTTQIISHELSLAIENGYEISEDFKKYLDELKERHEENMKKAERLKI